MGKVRAQVGSTMWVYNKFLRTQTKLRWVCGLCGVWCKDENGFKCHLQHESHIQKSRLARQGKGQDFVMTEKDAAFATRFVNYVAQNYLNQKVLLHDIYREMYPEDIKRQLLIKSTCWGTLGVFINALSRAGECEAYRDVKGWVVRIRQDRLFAAEAEARDGVADEPPEQVSADTPPAVKPSLAARPRSLPADSWSTSASSFGIGMGSDSQAMEEDGQLDHAPSMLSCQSIPEVRVPKSASEQMQESWSRVKPWKNVAKRVRSADPAAEDGGAARSDALARAAAAAAAAKDPHISLTDQANQPSAMDTASEAGAEEGTSFVAPVSFSLRPANRHSKQTLKPGSADDLGVDDCTSTKSNAAQRSIVREVSSTALPALPPGLVVKVLCRSVVGGAAFGQKAITLDRPILGDAVGRMLSVSLIRPMPVEDGGSKRPVQVVAVRRERLETVLPKLGGQVRVLIGPHAGSQGRLLFLELSSFSCSVELVCGARLQGLPYEHVCKVWDGSTCGASGL